MKWLIFIFVTLLFNSCQEKIVTINSYDFEFCQNCNTLSDIYYFEKNRGAKEIVLTGKQANRIFSSISCPLFPYENDTMESYVYFLIEPKNHFVKEISAYSIIDDDYFFSAHKYFYNDPILDTLVKLNYERVFDKDEFRAMFNYLRDDYRNHFKGLEEYHYDMNESCKRKQIFEFEVPKFLKKNLNDTHSIWDADTLSVSLIYDFSYIFNKLDEKSNTIKVDVEDRAIYLLESYR